MVNFEDRLCARARATPTALALVIGEQQWDYRALDQVVDGYCLGLQRAGVVAGQHVALLLPNRLPYVALIHALARLGAVLVPLNTRLAARRSTGSLSKVMHSC